MISRSGVIYFYQNQPQKQEDAGVVVQKSLVPQRIDERAPVPISKGLPTQDEKPIKVEQTQPAVLPTKSLDQPTTKNATPITNTSASNKLPVSPLQRPQQPVRPVSRTIPQVSRFPAPKRPLMTRSPLFSPRSIPKAPQRPAVPFSNGTVSPVIEEVIQYTKGEGKNVTQITKDVRQPVAPTPEIIHTSPVATTSTHKTHVPASTPEPVSTPVPIETKIKTPVVETHPEPVITAHLTTTVPVISDTPQRLPEKSKDTLDTKQQKKFHARRFIGAVLMILATAGVIFPIIPQARLETSYATQQLEKRFDMMVQPTIAMPPAVPLSFSPMIGPDGKEITPINKDYSIIVPKLGINAAIVASVDPLNAKEYTEALKKGVAHAKTSYFPNQDGAVYLFSHSTNYEWFVKDLNAIFYNLKNLEEDDLIIIFYQGKRYTYKYKSREIVAPRDTTYLLPVTGKRQLILQTCWPPGTLSQRLLIFADFVEEHGTEI